MNDGSIVLQVIVRNCRRIRLSCPPPPVQRCLTSALAGGFDLRRYYDRKDLRNNLLDENFTVRLEIWPFLGFHLSTLRPEFS